jgi:hypothetical protein
MINMRIIRSWDRNNRTKRDKDRDSLIKSRDKYRDRGGYNNREDIFHGFMDYYEGLII